MAWNIVDKLGELLFGDLHKSLSGSGLTSAEVEANEFNAEEAAKSRAFNAEEAQKNRDFQLEMDNTKVQRSVADMKAAGVNPAMMMGGSGVTTSTPSGSAASSSPASAGAPRRGTASLDSLMNIAMIGQRFKESNANIEVLKSEANKNKSEASKINEETNTIRINNEFLTEFNRLRNDGQAIENDLNKERIGEIRSNIRNIDVNTLAQTASISVYEAQALKYNTDAYIASQMLPFQQKLVTAQAGNEMAQAQYAMVRAAYEQGMIDNGYIESVCREMGASADYQEFLTAIKTGDPDGKVYEGKFAEFVGRTAAACGALIEASGVGSVFSGSVSKSTVSKK